MTDLDWSVRAPSDDRDIVSSPRRRVLQGFAIGGVIAATPSLETIRGRLDDESRSDEGSDLSFVAVGTILHLLIAVENG